MELPNFEKLGQFFTHGGHPLDNVYIRFDWHNGASELSTEKTVDLPSLNGMIRMALRKVPIITGKKGFVPPHLMQQVLI